MAESKRQFRVTFFDTTTRSPLTVMCRGIDNSPLGLMHVQLSDWVFPESRLVLPGHADVRARFDGIKRLHVLTSHVLEVAEMHEGEVLKLAPERMRLAVAPPPEPGH